MSVHRGARGFSVTAETYERARPEYPAAAVDAVVDAFSLGAGATVVDLGAGTGKLTRLLVARGLDVVAVEPIAEMRRVLARVVPEAEAVEGTAEEIPVADAAADVVTAAQAFHWFEMERALPEIHRVLRPGGGLAVLWNERDLDDPLQVQLEELVAPYRAEYPSGGGAWEAVLARSDLFDAAREMRFPNPQLVDAEEVVERVASISWIGTLEQEERADVLRRARELVADRDGRFPFVYRTVVYTCRRR